MKFLAAIAIAAISLTVLAYSPRVASTLPVTETANVAGAWSGTWNSLRHEDHRGSVTCQSILSIDGHWTATLIVFPGDDEDEEIVRPYLIQLTGRVNPSKPELVLFEGDIDLGSARGGVFRWSGEARPESFRGEFIGRRDSGYFVLSRFEAWQSQPAHAKKRS